MLPIELPKPLNRVNSSVRNGLAGALALMCLAVSGIGLAAGPADFRVESPISGKVFRLSEARGQYVALHFLLKTECPFCLRHTRAYAKDAGSLPGVTHVLLKPDAPDEIKRWAAQLGPEAGQAIEVYRDAEASLAKAYGIPDGFKFHGQTVHYPALILLDPAGKEVFRHVGKDNTDRFTLPQLKAKIAELKAAAPGR